MGVEVGHRQRQRTAVSAALFLQLVGLVECVRSQQGEVRSRRPPLAVARLKDHCPRVGGWRLSGPGTEEWRCHSFLELESFLIEFVDSRPK